MDLKGVDDVSCLPMTSSPQHLKFSEIRKIYGSSTSVSDSECVEPLIMRLNQFRLKGVGCDVMFIVGDEKEKFLVHKLVFGCSSPVFHAMFYGSLGIASAKNIVILPAHVVHPFSDLKSGSKNDGDTTMSHSSLTPGGYTGDAQPIMTSPHELNEKFHNFSTEDNPPSVDEKLNADNSNTKTPKSSLFEDEMLENVEEEEEDRGEQDDFVDNDEEASDEEETQEDEELMCSTSSADCSLNSSASAFSTSNRSDEFANSFAQKIEQNNENTAAKGVPTSIRNGNGNPFDLHNTITTFPMSGSASPPVKVQRTNAEQQQEQQERQQLTFNNFRFHDKNANFCETKEPTTECQQRQSPKFQHRVHFANSANVANDRLQNAWTTTSFRCGETAATTTTKMTEIFDGIPVEAIHVPDISPIAFSIMVEYIYNNYDAKCVELTDENIMHTLYAAKKYDLHSLVSECVRYLLNGLSPCNAVCLLAQARLFQEDTLLRQCFDVIDKNTDTALQAANIADVDRDTLMEVLARSDLDPSSELVIFEAARSWAEAECQRRQLLANAENLRMCLGAALQLIRFPLMSVKEFGEVAKLHLLTYEEIAEVYMHLTVKPRPFCRYPNAFRCGSRTKHVINRFSALSSKRNRRENKICFTTDRDVLVSALGIYGIAQDAKHIGYIDPKATREWSYQVEIQLSSVTDPSTYGSSVSHSATNNVFLHGTVGDSTPFTAYFDSPVPCQANVTYVASIRYITDNSIHTFGGKDGKDTITVELPCDDQTVTFKFQSYRNSYGSDEAEGQIPIIHFMVQWPQTDMKK